MSKELTLREKWLKEMTWVLTDQAGSDRRSAEYKAEHIFELLSKNIFNTSERDDFKRLSVALSDYLKTLNFAEEMGQLQLIALSFAFGFYYRKLEEKHIVKIKGKSNEEPNNTATDVKTSAENH